MPEDHAHGAEPPKEREESPARAVRPRDAASIVVLRMRGDEPSMLMGMRGAKHRFMPNRLVFPGGAVESADLAAPTATSLRPHTARLLRKAADQHLAHGIAVAAARELEEETGLSLGKPPRLDTLEYLCRAITPASSPIRFNARFLLVAEEAVSGMLGGDGELENLRFYGMREALALDLALPTRLVIERARLWIAMDDAARHQRTEAPILRDRSWHME